MKHRIALPVIFFLSGGASLLFETLWFRLCGLVFGNSAWASAVVLGSFMAGLAIGNALSPRLQRRDPIRAYARLEFTIAGAGLLLVLLLPLLPQMVAPMVEPLPIRLVFAFVLLLIPSTVMGATLPTMVGAMSRNDPNFGRVLGLLYGCNTMGAVAGSLAGELLLIGALGVRGTGVVAALGSATAGLAALRWSGGLQPAEDGLKPVPTFLPKRLLAAAALAGFSLLALEVIWFRFAILFTLSTSVTFAVMLAVVLAGIGFGALATSAALSRMPDADRFTPIVAAASAIALVISYAGFSAEEQQELVSSVFIDSVRLMLLVSLLSGVLFTVIGRAVERAMGNEVRATAATTFANTVGAAFGPLVAGFILLPSIGIERSFFVVAVAYVLIALLTIRADAPRTALITAMLLAVGSVALFPFGLFGKVFLPFATRKYAEEHIVAVREGPVETAIYLRMDYSGEPYMYRLFTNGYSMSGTSFASKRYMSVFVYLPLALRPHASNALLISYGVGVTAKALTDSAQLHSIDIVDISKNILDLSSIVWPGRSLPLADPRVQAHVEDGRFFLLTTKKRFDLITAEPPPPKDAGVVNLYTREHFQWMRNRLSDNGIVSYWLPVYQMTDADNRSIIRAFCDVFADCSLWTGAGGEWILLGSRGTARPPTAAEFSAQWSQPASGEWLRRIGIETPPQLAATFIADPPMLKAMTGHALPVTDDFPLRLSPHPTAVAPEFVFPMLDAAPAAFQRSAFVRSLLPPEIFAAATPYFAAEKLFDRALMVPLGTPTPPPALVKSLLMQTQLRTLPRFIFGSDAWLEDIARRKRAAGDRDPRLPYILAVGAMADRDYKTASALFAEALRGMPGNRELTAYKAVVDTLAQ